MQVGGGAVDVVGLYTLALIINVCGFLWAAGIAMRLRTVQAGPLMQMPVFLLLFLAPVYVPLSLLGGTLHSVARFNPVTYALEAGPRPPRRRPGSGRARLRPRARPRARLLGLGVPGPASRRGGRLSTDGRPRGPVRSR